MQQKTNRPTTPADATYRPGVQVLSDLLGVVSCDDPLTMTLRGTPEQYPTNSILITPVPDEPSDPKLANCANGMTIRKVLYSAAGSEPGTVNVLTGPGSLLDAFTAFSLGDSAASSAGSATGGVPTGAASLNAKNCFGAVVVWHKQDVPSDRTGSVLELSKYAPGGNAFFPIPGVPFKDYAGNDWGLRPHLLVDGAFCISAELGEEDKGKFFALEFRTASGDDLKDNFWNIGLGLSFTLPGG